STIPLAREDRRAVHRIVPVEAVAARSVIDEFDERAAITPDALAILAPGCGWTYGELQSRVRTLARVLITRGVGPD
ncbi:hypothetical protein, partial [Escherichia coli]|uniref:hypothetical protein n=1 Tax=Escherichia coli TaxID=562 RepID=UPI0028DFB6AD